MRSLLLAVIAGVATVAFSAPSIASAQDVRYGPVQYVRAAKCAAYLQLPQLSQNGSSAFLANVRANASRQPLEARDEAQSQARSVRLSANRVPVDQLRARRDEACAGLLTGPLSAQSTTSPAA